MLYILDITTIRKLILADVYEKTSYSNQSYKF